MSVFPPIRCRVIQLFYPAYPGIPGIVGRPADGAFYAFVKVAGDDMEVASWWFEKGHVAATLGSAFSAPGWVRLSYAMSVDKLRKAMDRIKRVG